MNQQLHELADSIFEYNEISEQDEQDFLMYLLSTSYYTNLDEFCTKYIPMKSAQHLVFAKDDVMEDYTSNNELPFNLITAAIEPSPATFAYNLTIDTPELATELLDALLYYRTTGKI
jgi:hypothetical protein